MHKYILNITSQIKLFFLQKIRRLNRLLDYPSQLFIFRYLRVQYGYLFYIRSALKRQLKPIPKDLYLKLDHPKKILIPMIESSHYQFYHLLGLAKALQLRGADVKLLLCGSLLNGCELKSIRTSEQDPCFSCRFNHEKVIPFYNLDTVQLSDFISKKELLLIETEGKELIKNTPESYIYQDIDIMPMVNESVTRFFYGASSDYSEKKVRKVLYSHIQSSMVGIAAANKIFSQWQPDIVFSNMGAYSAFEPYYRVAVKNNVKYNMITTSEFDYFRKLFNWYELNDSKRFLNWVESRKSKFLTSSEEIELEEFLKTRSSGKSDVFLEFGYFDSDNEKEMSFNIDKKKRNIFLFSSIYWDVGLNELNTIYDGMLEWVIDSIEIIKNQPDTHLYIKTHPGEYFTTSRSLKTVEDFIIESFPNLPSNVTILSPSMKIKPYDLFSFIDLGLVYNGTIGLEMLLNNIPVVNSGIAPYMALDSVMTPKSLNEYKNFLRDESIAINVNRNEVNIFAYFYFIKTLIPWTITDKARDNNFRQYKFDNLSEILPGEDRYLDHMCDCILNKDGVIPECW